MTATPLSGRSRVFGVVGDPVAHSLSPALHNAWIAETGANAVYVPFHLKTDDARSDLAALARAGCAGLNITLPHKVAALAAASQSSEEAHAIGAANTLSLNADRTWTAHNTDVSGFAFALGRSCPGPLSGARCLLIGAGGSARAALYHLRRAGAEVTIANRTRERAAELAGDLCPGARVISLADVEAASRHADMVVNTASFGHDGDAPPSLSAGGGRAYLDLSYGQAASAALAAARSAGWVAEDGLAMLAGQAADAFAIWFGARPDPEPALARCRLLVAGGAR
jgi:shikimate dehydrogenase